MSIDVNALIDIRRQHLSLLLLNFFFFHVLRDSTPRFVGQLGPSVGQFVPFLGSGPEGADDLCFHT